MECCERRRIRRLRAEGRTSLGGVSLSLEPRVMSQGIYALTLWKKDGKGVGPDLVAIEIHVDKLLWEVSRSRGGRRRRTTLDGEAVDIFFSSVIT